MPYTYRPRHQRQIVSNDPYGGVNCAAYSCAMAIERATMGGTLITGQQVRALSNEPIPDPSSPGLNIGQLVAVGRRLYVQIIDKREDDDGWSEVIACLRAQRGVILQGDYDQMGTYSCQKSFRGDHAVYVNHLDTTGTKAWMQDPLCATGKYVPLSVLKAYAEKLARAKGIYPHIFFATTRKTPLMNSPMPGV